MLAHELSMTSRAEPLAASAACFRVDVHADIAAHGANWPRTGERGDAHCHVFQTVEFLTTWQNTYGRTTRAETLYVSVRETDGSPLLLLPLAIVRRWGLRELSFIDASAADYNAPVLFPTNRIWTRETATALWAAVLAALPPCDIVSLVKLPAAVGGIANPLHALAERDNPESCHGTDLTGSWEQIERTLRNLKTIRKQTRNLERIAPLSLRASQTPADVRPLLETMLAQKQRRFEETMVPGFDAHPEKADFLDQGSVAFAENGTLRFYGLYVGEKILATAWGIMHAGIYYWIVISSEAGEWARLSPGRVLHRLLLQALHAEGCRYIDNGIGDEQWKLDNLNRTVTLRMHVEPRTRRGRAALARRRALNRLRGSSIWQRLRPYKWIALRKLRGRIHPSSRRIDEGGNSS